MTYAEKLKDPRWQKKRLEVFHRDGFRCIFCQDETSTLHVHHTYYSKNKEAWDYPLESLETHCEHCHFCVEYLKKEGSSLVVCKSTKLKYNNTNRVSVLFLVNDIKEGDKGIVILIIEDDIISHGTYITGSIMDSIIEMYQTPIPDGKPLP